MSKRKWLSPEEYAKVQAAARETRKKTTCAFNKYEDKKNVAMLDYPMSPPYTVHFDQEANLKIMINHGCSWSAQNHLHYYAGKCKDYFKIYTSAWSVVDEEVWELLYDGQKEKKEI